MTSPELEPRGEAERLSFIEPICNFLLDVKRLVKTSCLSFNLGDHRTRNKGRVFTPPLTVSMSATLMLLLTPLTSNVSVSGWLSVRPGLGQRNPPPRAG